MTNCLGKFRRASFTAAYIILEFAAELQASLKEFTASGIVEVRENGGRIAPFSWEVRGDSAKTLLHLWSEQFNRRAAFWR